MAPEISIVLTCYNFRPYLRAAVESLLGQRTRRTLEIIVIDDASPDGSAEVLDGLEDPRLRLIRHATNGGAPARISEGIAAARGKYVGRFDGDDQWLPDALERLAAALDAHPAASVAYANIRTIDAAGRVGDLGTERPPGPLLREEFGLLLQQHYTCAPAMLGRMDCWRALFPLPAYARQGPLDWYTNLKLAEMGPFIHVPEVLAHYRVHALGMHSTYIRDRSGEHYIRQLLDQFLPAAGARLPEPAHRVRGRHLLGLARSYFAADMAADARRVYAELLRDCPSLLLNRHDLGPALAALSIGKQRYERLKQSLRRG
ncbi:MAG: glycosyltransferase family 2 protein [Xanthomonadales bacterium]|nr:glycosyltransferase family 2 protein [Xanthomonadales bacterium]